MKTLAKILANIIFVAHAALVVFVLFGWAFSGLWYVYMSALVVTLISDIVFGYCLLSKWEFDLRKYIDPKVNYDYTWSSFYTYRLTNYRISNKTINRTALVFIISSLVVNLLVKFL